MLNALVSSEQERFQQTSETVCTDGRVPGEIWEKAPDFEGRQLKSVEPVVRYCKQLTVGRTQVLPTVDTGGLNTVVRRQCAAVQTPVNCHCQLEKHPVGSSQ